MVMIFLLIIIRLKHTLKAQIYVLFWNFRNFVHILFVMKKEKTISVVSE